MLITRFINTFKLLGSFQNHHCLKFEFALRPQQRIVLDVPNIVIQRVVTQGWLTNKPHLPNDLGIFYAMVARGLYAFWKRFEWMYT